LSGVRERQPIYCLGMSSSAAARWSAIPVGAYFARVGTPRRPVLTGAVFVVTAAALIAQLADSSLLGQVQRDAAAIDAGQWWRLLTGMFFQDGGIIGGVFNLVALAVVGTLAEWSLGRVRWFVLYFGCGLFGQFLSYLWLNPVGAGNSMCVAGLLGALAVVVLRLRRAEPPRGLYLAAVLIAPLAVLDTVLHDNHGMPALLGVVLAVLLTTNLGRAARVPAEVSERELSDPLGGDDETDRDQAHADQQVPVAEVLHHRDVLSGHVEDDQPGKADQPARQHQRRHPHA
jgi:membrane associated rhomboid family serine protease